MDQQQHSPAMESPLDQLEAQVNLVLEHTGRLFAGSARNQKDHTIANNPAKLKHVLSGAIDNFHDALDVLEEELAIARAVMRRDLAVCRTALGAQATEARSSEQTASNGVKDEIKREGENSESAHDVDVDMTGDSSKISKDSPPHEDSNPAAIATADVAQDQQLEEQRPDQAQNDQRPQEPLQIDIPSGEHQGDNTTDAQTGTYSNFDFESLFNDPSAHPSPDIAQVPEQAPEPSQPKSNALAAESIELKADQPADSNNLVINQSNVATQNNDTSKPAEIDAFDFGDLTNFGDSNDTSMHTGDNDNISSLLPGLESYANAPTSNNTPQQSSNQPADDTFNIFDAAGAPDFGTNEPDNSSNNNNNDNNNNNNNGQQGGDKANPEDEQTEQRDDTFDALMNFDNFDMGSFGGGDDGDDGNTAFDASFFDIS